MACLISHYFTPERSLHHHLGMSIVSKIWIVLLKQDLRNAQDLNRCRDMTCNFAMFAVAVQTSECWSRAAKQPKRAKKL